MRKAPWTDLARLKSAIERALPGPVRAHIQSIVNIGCGRCDECDLLLELFPYAAVTLVEMDRACIDHLAVWQAATTRDIHVVYGDGRQLDGIAPGPFDIAIIRHPDLDAQPDNWAGVFQAAVARLTAAGILLILTYSTAETETARKILRMLPVEELRRVSGNLSPVALAGNDRYILMYRRVDL